MKSSYTALYRRWRPQLFSDVVGQEHVTRTLQNALQGDRVAHAYLFCGLRGTGKTTMAKLLAKALNCREGVQAEPCNQCDFCREITEGRSMDVQEIDAASNRGIDEIRELREKVRYSSAQYRYKVYIIDEVHMLTNEAFNALLKTLEEPPPRVVFILATTETHKLPLTVISRCQRFDFHLLDTRQVAGRLREVAEAIDFHIDDESLFLLARQAEGSLRDAMGFLEQCRAYGGEKIEHQQVLDILGLASPEAIYRFFESVIQENIQSGLAEIKDIVFRGRDLHRFLKEMLLYLRKLILLQVGEKESSVLDDVPALQPYLLKHRGRLDHQVILEMLETIQELTYQLKGASQPHFLFELAFLRLVRIYRFRRYLNPADLLNRLEELEEKLHLKAGLLTGLGESSGTPVQPEQTREERPPLEREKPLTVAAGEEEAAASLAQAGHEEKPLTPPSPNSEEDPGDIIYSLPPPETEKDSAGFTFPGDSLQRQKDSEQPVQGKSGDNNQETPSNTTPTAPQQAPREIADVKDIDLKKVWLEQVLPGLKKRRQTQATYLQNYLSWTKAVPLSWKEGIFTLGVSPSAGKVLIKRLEDQENRGILSALLQEILQAPVELRFVVHEAAENEISPAGETGTPTDNPQIGGLSENVGTDLAQKARKTQKSQQDDYYMKNMLELFNGQLIQTNGDSMDSLEFWSYASPMLDESSEDEEAF